MKINSLASKLSTCDFITQFDRPGHSEGWGMAISFSDINESFRKINDELLPMIEKANDPDEIKMILFDIGEEMRHALYHIFAMRFYDSIKGMYCDPNRTI